MRRTDYSPDVTGSPPVAHYTKTQTFDGFVFPTRRRAHLHDAGGVADRISSAQVSADTPYRQARRATMQLAFETASDLEQALVRAGTAHGQYEEELGQGRDENWPSWYAQYIEREQAEDPTRSSAKRLTFASASDLAEALLRAERVHGEHQAQTGGADPDWPSWYARYFEREQAPER